MIKYICFDLDNTLYDQKIYFESSFKEIGNYLRKYYAVSADDVIRKLWLLFKYRGSMYHNLFDDLLNHLGIYHVELIEVLVKLFHEAPVSSLVLFKDAKKIIPLLNKEYMLGLITNGHVEMQKRKFTALGLQEMIKIQVYTAEIGFPKPASEGYYLATKAANVRPQDSLYVGDNPYVDFTGAKRIGMHTVRLLRGEFRKLRGNDALIDNQVQDFCELRELLPGFFNSGKLPR